uniref:Uncharacterized protein n=1 Tax=Cucumis melo TaxID=3656 RepID=A0A9I9ECJ3_CUCME
MKSAAMKRKPNQSKLMFLHTEMKKQFSILIPDGSQFSREPIK